MSLRISAFFFDSSGSPQLPAAGLSPLPTIRIRRLSDNALVVTDDIMTEVGDGFYQYDFGAGSPEIFDQGEEYAARAFAGALTTPRDRYATGSFGNNDLDKNAAFLGGVHVDTLGGGTAGTAFPIGTQAMPVDNLTDARTIADQLNTKTFFVRGAVTLDQAYFGYQFIALAGGGSIVGNGQDAGACIFRNVGLTGTFASTADMFVFEGSFFGTTTNWRGVATQAAFSGTIIVDPGQIATFASCASIVAGLLTPQITAAGVGTEVNLRNYSGGMNFVGMNDATSLASLEFAAGQVILDPSNTAGSIVLRGIAKSFDNSAGVTVTKQAFIERGFLPYIEVIND